MSSRAYELQFILSLLLTLAIEIPVLYASLRLLCILPGKALPLTRILAAGFFASFATLPYVWFIMPWLIRQPFVYSLVSETAVWLVEALFYAACLGLKPGRAGLVSLLCNAASFLAGEGLKRLG